MGNRHKHCPQCGGTFPGEALFCPDDGAPLSGKERDAGPDPRIGTKIAGELQLLQLIGLGATGRVYQAHELSTGRNVAVKVLRKSLCTNPEAIARLRREEAIIKRLNHPAIVRASRMGTFEEPSADSPCGRDTTFFLVMEHLQGLSLRTLLATAGVLPVERAVRLIALAAHAVGSAHREGIVHRDLKPENLLVLPPTETSPETVKVLDFGAAGVNDTASTLTKSGAIFGTAHYISPEAARGEEVQAPADVYALTTMLYELLCGVPPFEGTSPVQILIQHASAPVPPLGERRAAATSSDKLSPELLNIIEQNLKKQPAARFPDAQTLGAALTKLYTAESAATEPHR